MADLVDRLGTVGLWGEAREEILRLRAELAKHQESEFHPDWSMLEATRASLREHMEIIRGLRAELAFATQERNAYQDAVDVACEERDRLRAERDSQQRVCIKVMAELAECKKDAERYRWLRDDGDGFEITVRETDEDGGETWVAGYPPNELDAAIDAAREGK